MTIIVATLAAFVGGCLLCYFCASRYRRCILLGITGARKMSGREIQRAFRERPVTVRSTPF